MQLGWAGIAIYTYYFGTLNSQHRNGVWVSVFDRAGCLCCGFVDLARRNVVDIAIAHYPWMGLCLLAV